MNHLTPDFKNNHHEIYIISTYSWVPILMGTKECPRVYGVLHSRDHYITYC